MVDGRVHNLGGEGRGVTHRERQRQRQREITSKIVNINFLICSLAVSMSLRRFISEAGSDSRGKGVSLTRIGIRHLSKYTFSSVFRIPKKPFVSRLS
jgi:hypothetical protein